MSDGVGLSVGASRLAAVVVGRTAVTRSPVLTRFAHRPPEVGVPSENPNLTERGLIITDFVDRVGDPVDIVAADGTSHRADAVLADALRALLFTVGGGRVPDDPVAVTHPAHWRPAAVDALRNALAALPEFQQGTHAPVVSDAAAALTALQDDPGLPTRGVIALCDFGGTGTSITLVDAANGYTPVAPTVRDTDFSGDLVDQALLTGVINDLSAAGTIDLSGTSAIGSLSRLRAQCRGAKERLSTSGVTSLVAELPGHRSEVRLTRNELDDAIRQPLAALVGVLQDTLDRNGIRPADVAAIASVGGGARIPLITTTLSEQFKVPVITTPQPELSAAIGGGLAAVRGTVEEGATSMAAAAPVAAAAAAATQMAPELAADDEIAPTGGPPALAWSDAHDVPDVAPTDPYDYSPPGEAGDVRPPVMFHREPDEDRPAPIPWHRRPAVAMGTGLVVVLAALGAAVLWVLGDDSAPTPASTTAPVTTTTTTAPPSSAAPPPPAEPPATQAPPPRTRTVYQQPPAPQPVTEPPATQQPPPPPPPPPPTSEAPPPPPPSPEPPPPSTTQPPPWSPTAPYPTIPGLPWVPAPQLPGQPVPGP